MRRNRSGTGPRGGGSNHERQRSEANTSYSAPVPKRVREVLRKHAPTHPGLALDKYAASWSSTAGTDDDGQKRSEAVQLPTVRRVAEIARVEPRGLGFATLADRQRRMLEALGGRTFVAETAGALTLHLARAGALENAGLCLHPVYGFAYLPGSGLKGMARAYAETVWLEAQPAAERAAAWRRIEDVFGWAPSPERRKQIRDPAHPAEKRYVGEREIEARAGAVVFHDAWPEAWPKLVVDIVNNHHAAYYQATDNVPPPGDWENPRPVYFLAVEGGSRFHFALAPRRTAHEDDRLLELAHEWLLGALVHEGAGAKTAAGYGRFRPVGIERPVLDSPARATFEAELELVTPAFLAGASQNRDDCALRPATLRGLLRWWWRTLHAGHLEPAELRRLETAVWGSTEVGGAVRIEVEPLQRPEPVLYDKNAIRRDKHLPRPDSGGIPGLSYFSYGMDEKDRKTGAQRKRWYVEPGARWRVRLTARGAVPGSAGCEPEGLLAEARAALWLLCEFGGVGAKARKGFGSLAVPTTLEGFSVESVRAAANRFRRACGIPDGKISTPRSSSLDHFLLMPVDTDWTDPWIAIDQVGAAVQAFTRKRLVGGRKVERRALGLPRQQRGVDPSAFPLGPNTRRTNRHASPVHIRIGYDEEGYLRISLLAFPAPELPESRDGKASQKVLTEYLEFVGDEIGRRSEEYA